MKLDQLPGISGAECIFLHQTTHQTLQLGVWGREFEVQACGSCKAAVEAGYPNVATFIPVSVQTVAPTVLCIQ